MADLCAFLKGLVSKDDAQGDYRDPELFRQRRRQVGRAVGDDSNSQGSLLRR